jgi:hypothetical protein
MQRLQRMEIIACFPGKICLPAQIIKYGKMEVADDCRIGIYILLTIGVESGERCKIG